MKISKINLGLVIFFSLKLLADNQLGVQAQALGGAYRALANSNDTLFLNPAGIIKNRRLSPSTGFIWNSDANRFNLDISVIDSKTTNWGLGLAYIAGFSPKKEQDYSDHRAIVSLALPLFTDRVSLGANFRYSYNPNIFPADKKHFFNIDMGVLAQAGYGTSFAIVVNNLVKPKFQEKPMGLSFATAFSLGEIISKIPLSLSFDWTMDDVTSNTDLDHIISIGSQYVILGLVPVRAGFVNNFKFDTRYVSIGTGLDFTKVSMDFLYKQNLNIGKFRYFGFSLSMQI